MEMGLRHGLSVNHVSIRVSGQDVLHDISLAFPPGRITAILGPNGAGKSTLLRAMAGLLPLSAGEILLDGQKVHSLPRHRLARRLAILPQRLSAPADMTVQQLVACGRFPYHRVFQRRDRAKDDRAITMAMEATGITAFASRQVSELSGGESQRVWLAMTLAQEPDILLLDEPTTYLDIAHQIAVMQIIRRINAERGMTIVLVLHDLLHAAEYADSIAVLADHRLRAWGSPVAVLTPDLLRQVFGVTSEVFRSDGGHEVLLPTGLAAQT